MFKKFCITVILSLVLFPNLPAQNTRYAIHISNPVGFLNKVGVKFEVRTGHMGFLLSATQYVAIIVPPYPGTQVGLEWRKYSATLSPKQHESFFYSKLIGGHQDYRASYGDGFFNLIEVPEGYYYGLGAGFGRHFNFKQFFLELSGGLKGVLSTVKQHSSFYITGPASFLDMHFNLGFQF